MKTVWCMCDVMSHQKRPTMSAKLLFIILLYYFVPTSKSYFSSTKNIDQQCFCKVCYIYAINNINFVNITIKFDMSTIIKTINKTYELMFGLFIYYKL